MWVERLAGLALEQGVSGFLLAVAPDATTEARRFAEEVAPALREAVERERRPGPPREPLPVVITGVEGERPRLPKDPDEAPTDHGRAGQQLLVQVHDHLRAELAELREALVQVERGLRDAAEIPSLLARLATRQNQCSVGSFCAGYCRLVTIHHALEDRRLFPDLRRADGALDAVLGRLELEHEQISGLLAAVDDALDAMLADRTQVAPVRGAVDRLAELLLSHLGYEEEELLGPIGRHGIAV